MSVHVRIVVATGWWSGPGIVRIVRVASARWTILIGTSHATTWWGATIASLTPVIKLTRRCASAVVVTTRAITARGTTTVVVVIVGSGWVAAATAAHGRARAVSITAAIIWSTRASVGSPRLERRWRGRIGNILSAGHFLTLELTTVQLLHCGLQIGLRLVLDESTKPLIRIASRIEQYYVPSAIALATHFGVDNVQSRLTGKVFQVLYNRG
jgi:hypothetical protein